MSGLKQQIEKRKSELLKQKVPYDQLGWARADELTWVLGLLADYEKTLKEFMAKEFCFVVRDGVRYIRESNILDYLDGKLEWLKK